MCTTWCTGIRVPFTHAWPWQIRGSTEMRSGKSTAIEVLDFLARCATDGLEPALVAHGGMHAVRTAGVTAPVEIESSWNFVTLDGEEQRTWKLRWTLALDAGATGQVVLRSGSLRDGERLLLGAGADGARAVVDETAPPGLWVLRAVLREIRVLGAMASAPPWARASAERASARDALVISTEGFVGREDLGLATA